MSKSFIELEVGLLVAKYGRIQVLRTPAHRCELSLDELEMELDRIREVRTSKLRERSSRDRTRGIIEEAARLRPEIVEALEYFRDNCRMGTFLPGLGNVKQFVEHFSAGK